MAGVVDDSTVDESTDVCLSNKVRGKSNVVVEETTTDVVVFDGYHTVAVMERGIVSDDQNIFVLV